MGEGLPEDCPRAFWPRSIQKGLPGSAWEGSGILLSSRELQGNVSPNARVFLGELFPGRDGKFRYLREIRIEMYRKMVKWLREGDPDLFIYLCMESKEVWDQVFGWSPSNNNHLNHLFEEQLKKFMKRD